MLKTVPTIMILTILTAGCSERRAPDPPTAKSELTLELINAIGEKDHQTAINKIQRLRVLDKGNVFLAVLESRQRENLVIAEAQAALDAGDVAGALKVVDDNIAANGQTRGLLDAQSELKNLLRIKSIIKSMQHPGDSLSLTKDCLTLRKLGADYAPARKLDPFISAKIELAREMHAREKALTLFNLRSELTAAIDDGDHPTSGTALAMLRIEAPPNDKAFYFGRKPNKASEYLSCTVAEPFPASINNANKTLNKNIKGNP